MHFQRLRLSGFKSFVDPTEFRIEPGLTGIVGPNGCGKSNLLVALRWVMGANSAKAMRAGGMDDVIFAGSGNRPSRNHAEVSLTIDNSDRSAPASTARVRNGSSLRCAYHWGQPAASGVLSSGRLAMNPGHGAPKPPAPAACSRARSVPNWNAASGVAGPGWIIEMTSACGPTASTSGTGTAAASASQRKPFASAANAAATSADPAAS